LKRSDLIATIDISAAIFDVEFLEDVNTASLDSRADAAGWFAEIFFRF
jgi:hypothetical protein